MVVTLRGQVVCPICWFEVDNRKVTPYGTQEDRMCAKACAQQGTKQALAVWNGDRAKLYLLENHAAKIKGGNFLQYIGDQVEVKGQTDIGADGKAHIRVDEILVLATSL